MHYWTLTMQFGLVNKGNPKPLTSVPIGSSPFLPAHYTWDWTFPCCLLLWTGNLSLALLEDLHGSCCECPLNFEEVRIVHQAPDQVVWGFISSRSFVIASPVSPVQQDTGEVWRRFLSLWCMSGAAAEGPSRFFFSTVWEAVKTQRAATNEEKPKRSWQHKLYSSLRALTGGSVCLCCWHGDSSGSGDLPSVFQGEITHAAHDIAFFLLIGPFPTIE